MPVWLLVVALFGPAPVAKAAGECPDLPLCARLAKPRVAFFLGEAVAERHREGRQPEYRFQVREAITGLPPALAYGVIETAEGVPPSGLHLIQARLSNEDGVLSRDRCDFAAPYLEAQNELDLLRRSPAADAALTVKVSGVQDHAPGEVRILADGPLSRWADRDGRFPALAPGVYRLTISAPGYRTGMHVIALAAGGCSRIETRMEDAGL